MKVKITMQNGIITKQGLYFVKALKEYMNIGLKDAKFIYDDFRANKIKFVIVDISSDKYYEFKSKLNEMGVDVDKNRKDKLKKILEYQKLDEIEKQLNEIKNMTYESLGNVMTEDKVDRIWNYADEILKYIKDKNVIVTEIE
jgi:hypothetical protein